VEGAVELIGTVVRLQVQCSRLKPGPATTRFYDPSPLLEVAAVDVGPRGVVGVTESGPVVDVHHADHPDSRNRRLTNGLSLLPRPHYASLRARFGSHLVEGVAGESVLLDTPVSWDPPGPTGELVLETADGEHLALADVVPIRPCIEFARWCLRRPVGPVDDEVQATMQLLDDGARGYYAVPQGSGRIETGARLLIP
jgi:hypothetical protein